MNSARNNFCIICKTIPVFESNGQDENINIFSMYCEKCSHALNIMMEFNRNHSDIKEEQSESRETHNKSLVRREMETDTVFPYIDPEQKARVIAALDLRPVSDFQILEKELSTTENLQLKMTQPKELDMDKTLRRSKSFQCPECNKNFHSNYNMRRHYKTHGETVCTGEGNEENKAKNTNNKIYIMKRKDTSEFAEGQSPRMRSRLVYVFKLKERYSPQCQECHKLFSSHSNLKRHYKSCETLRRKRLLP